MATTFVIADVRLVAAYSDGSQREVTTRMEFITFTGDLLVRLGPPDGRGHATQIDLYGPDGGSERYTLAEGGQGGGYAIYAGGASRLAVLWV